MKLPIYQLDAFTSRLFGGNPASVVLLKEWLPDATMQAIAAENNQAETAFVIPRPDISPLRWFAPKVEIDLCGHATLATAHVLFAGHFPKARHLEFSTMSGTLAVDRVARSTGSGPSGDLLALDFPARPGKPTPVSDQLVRALGVRPREVFAARDILAVFDTEGEVRAIAPDFAAIAAIDTFAVIVSAPGDKVDFVSRFFVPRAGVPEDPATGSAHCTLIPYWATRLKRSKLSAQQLSARGAEFECELRGNRVSIAGRVVEYLRGEITV